MADQPNNTPSLMPLPSPSSDSADEGPVQLKGIRFLDTTDSFKNDGEKTTSFENGGYEPEPMPPTDAKSQQRSMKKEADPLVKGSNGDAARSRTSSYGAVPENAGDPVEVTIKDGKDKSDEKPPLPPVGLCQMFRYATIGDVFLMMLGTIFSIVHGAGWPAVNFIFGGMTDTMVGSGVNTTGLNVTNGSYLPEFEDKMNNTSLYYVYVACGVLVAAYCQTSFWQWTCERQIYRMRKKFFESLLRQTIGWYDHHQSGELTTRLADDLERVREGMGEKVAMLTQMLAAFATGFGMAFYKNWSMTLVMMAMTPLLIIGGAAISIAVSKLAKKEQEIYASAGAVAEEVLSCAKTVMSFNGQLKEVLRYDKALIGAQKAGVRKGLLTGGSLAFTFMVLYGSYALAFWYGAKLVGDGGISPGDVFTVSSSEALESHAVHQVFFCVMIGSFSLGNMAPSVTAVSTARGAAAKVFEVIDNIPEIDSTSTQGTWLQDLRGDIKFSGVSFAYPTRPDVPVLKDVSLEVKSGQKVAIVGSSGCGKSTIVNLILRFYDPLAGKIYIDGSEVKSLCLRWLRQNIGVVSQEPVLFGCSIADNIRMGRENVTMEEIEAVAKLANAHNFVSKLPAKYSTIVGERGAQLSGGQKQRIAIARALIRNPKILLLDEATSALDSESESAVQAALEEASKGRTTIIIAHRLSTIRNADFIIALDKGEVAEVGTHEELMEREGVYHQLVTLQNFKDEATGAVEEFVNPTLAMKRQASVKSTEGDSKNEKEVDEDVPIPPYCRILSLNKPEVHLILLGTLGTILVGAAMPAFSVVFSQIIYIFRDFEMSKNRPTLDREAIFWSMMYLVLGGATAIGNMTSLGMFSVSGERMTRRLRLAAFKNILRQDLEYFEDPKHSTGALTTKLATEASLVRAATGIRIATVLQACVTMSAGLVIAFVYGWKLAFAILACVPIMALAGTVHMKVLSGNQKRDSQLLEDAGKTAGEAIENIRTVVALAREDKFYRDYCERLIAPHRESTKQAQIYGIAWGLSQSITFFMYAGAFRFGAWLIVQGEMNPEDVYRVIFAIAFSALAVGQGMSFLPDFSKAKLAAGHIFNILDRKPKIDSYSENGQMIHDVKGDISFQRVFFSYPRRQEVTVMKGINLDIPHGQTLALVGPSGCGKSTVVSLLQRLYDISDGEITIDGVDIRHLNVHWLRSLISVVSQEPILFNCSIEENVKYGVDDLSTVNHDDVIAVCKQANIHEFVMSLPKRYETLVGEKGTQLSGGQKQRLAIARALLRRPRILLLDEATSALDTESEKLVQAALDVAREGRTCIVVAHRLSTIQNADVIAVVEDGCIVEMGSHQELLNRKGAYFSLINGQRNIVT